MRLKFFTIFFVAFVIGNAVLAQLCQGSLGDPIININFGHGANPGPPLAAATTSYQYYYADCPNDGFYAVRNSTSSCFGSSWYNFSSDHTGDPNGYFMLINASFLPSAFYLDTVRGLCGNTTYEFAAWIMNVILPSACGGNTILPNLTFSIEKTDGAILQTYNTNSILTALSPVWKQYGFFFTTPAGVSDIVLRIFNNAPGGCGNDLALDDITFRPCGPLLTPSITGTTSNMVSLCEGTAGTYTFTCSVSAGFSNPVFQWQKRINNGSWTNIAGEITTSLTQAFSSAVLPGIYEYRLAVAEMGNIASTQCRINSQPLTVQVNAKPVTTASNNGPACERSIAVFTSTGGTQYIWTGPNGFSGSGASVQLANIQLSQAGKYYVTVTNAAGCKNSDSTMIAVNPSPLATTTFSTRSICAGNSIQLFAGGGPDYNWIPATGLSDPAISDPLASPSITTLFSVIVTNLFSCKDTANILINVITDPVVDAGPDRVILNGQRIKLNANVTGLRYTYTWSPANYIDDIYLLQPTVNPPSDISYILTAVSDIGCKTGADTMFIKVYPEIYIPNAFTPNTDGLNDTWNIPALAAYPNFELFIYNRYGQLVFRTKNTPVNWDGTFKGNPCPNGAYTYVIKTGDDRNMFTGTVMILR